MNALSYDVIVVGSGAGGAAAAYRLVKAGRRVLLLEKGNELPRDASTLDLERVIRQGAFKSKEPWLDGRGRCIVPEEYFNLGGKTKWYGAALLRFSEHEFCADAGHMCPAWPIRYADLQPYYEEVERMLGVRGFDCEPDLARIVAALTRREGDWAALPLPMGLAPDILAHPEEARRFDGFASVKGLKADAQAAFLEHVRGAPNLTVLTGKPVTELLPASTATRTVSGVATADGNRYRASSVLLGAGALHSPRLLQRYLARTGLSKELPMSDQVGRNLKLHLLTALIAVSPSRKHDCLRKTTALLSRALPHSSVQPLGFDAELIAGLMPRPMPRWLARQVGSRAYGFFLQTEDGSHPDNRVMDSDRRYQERHPRLDYEARRLPAALKEHRRLVSALGRSLLAAGYLSFSRRIDTQGTAHACGTLAAGHDASSSVVDADGRVHGLKGLYVVDGSALPRSSRVNPSLTIYAWSLRVVDRLLAQTNGGVLDAASRETDHVAA